MAADLVQIIIWKYNVFIIVFVAPENVCLGTKIEILSRMEAEILIFILFYMAAIVEIQDVCHISANNYLVIFEIV
jgi:hypothetical protein